MINRKEVEVYIYLDCLKSLKSEAKGTFIEGFNTEIDKAYESLIHYLLG